MEHPSNLADLLDQAVAKQLASATCLANAQRTFAGISGVFLTAEAVSCSLANGKKKQVEAGLTFVATESVHDSMSSN